MSDWRDLNNDLSDPDYVNSTGMIWPRGAPESAAKSLMKKGIYNLFPFKIVNLGWLFDIKKVSWAGYQRVDDVLLYFLMTFNENDNYLPVGDVILREQDVKTSNGGFNLYKHWVVLVKNDPKYSTRISDSAWESTADSYYCTQTNVAWSTRRVWDDNRNYSGDYKVVGDLLVTGDSEWWFGNTRTTSKGINGEKPRPFAAVGARYLSTKNIGMKDEKVTIQYLRGQHGCNYHFYFSATSPFYTFNADTSAGRGYPNYYFFDILPQALIANCCSNNVPSELDSSQACGAWKKDSDSCNAAMPNYCSGDKLNTKDCLNYCKNHDCDDNIREYCNSATDYNSQKQLFTLKKELCSCFMPSTFYEQYDNEKYSAMGSSGKKLIELLKASGVYGGSPECSNLQCKIGGSIIQNSTFKQGSCPSVNIQNCINEQATNNKGTIEAGSIDQSQVNNCVQQTQTVNQNISQPASAPIPQVAPIPQISPQTAQQFAQQARAPVQQEVTKPASNTKLYLIIGGIVFLLILILVLVFVFSGGDDAPSAVAAPVPVAAPAVAAAQFLRRRK